MAGWRDIRMVGALGAHFTRLGLEVQDDGGLLFALAWVVALSSGFVLYSELLERISRWRRGTSS